MASGTRKYFILAAAMAFGLAQGHSALAATVLLKLGGTTIAGANSFTQGEIDSNGARWNVIDTIRASGSTTGITGTGLHDEIPLSSASNLVDSANNPTGINATITDPLFQPNNQAVIGGPFTDPDNGFVYDIKAVRAYHFGSLDASRDNIFGEYTLSNLDANTKYAVTIGSARKNDSTTTKTDFTVIGSETQTGSVISGTNGGASFTLLKMTAMTPALDGTIKIQLTNNTAVALLPSTSAASASIINFVRLDTSPVPEPAAAMVLGLPGLALLRRKRH